MIVAGERRWRANQLAKNKKVFAIVKNYEKDSDIQRDSLVENELREDLNDTEFKAFTFSLAKSLGEPYFNKGWINVLALSKYIIGDNANLRNATFYRKLTRVFNVEKYATPKVKKLLKKGQLDLDTAERITKVKDKEIQDELAEMAKHKSTKEIRQEVQKHNFAEKAKELKLKLKQDARMNQTITISF